MKLPVGFVFTAFTTEFIKLMRNMAVEINRASDALQFTQAVNTGSSNKIARFLTATATLDFPSIAAGAIGSLNITVTGAVAGDSAILSAPAALEAGLTFSWLVTTNTVTIRLHNTTGAAIDPISASWKALVIGLG